MNAKDIAGDVWERYKGTQDPLWQIQLSQDSARPITFQMRDRFSDFLRTTDGMPNTLQEMQDECGIRLVVGDKNVALSDEAPRSIPPWILKFGASHYCLH